MIPIAIVALILLAPVGLGGGLLRYVTELRHAAERAYGQTAWIELELALTTEPGWVAALLRRIHRLVGTLVTEGRPR